jgi:hypothetical protein
MYGPRLCNDYIKWLDAFIDFTGKDTLNNIRENLCCPYKYCKNEKKYRTNDVLKSYLIKHGVGVFYTNKLWDGQDHVFQF